MSFNVFEFPQWVLYYGNISNEVELQLSKKLTAEPIKQEVKCMHGKLKTWNKRTEKNLQQRCYSNVCNSSVIKG